ncbi:ectonucleoside triphosphate diphosphohydrolase 8-like [Scyliorhinus canicula]|uniref:ectonucleoside triphosphate diphosphohydrolase 8-like n=1 Tax=Scyliorhinus canicula TaxID=7830 RepID=UPI0018F666BA|nr:ectonucleoside triphosphate diphosphohydrolase 8-like [Scyliorhinus canicula]
MRGHNVQLILRSLIITVLISAIITLILSLVGSKYLQLNPGTKYGIVLDAGSTHTSLYLYHWRADEENATGVISQLYDCDIDEGISSFANDPPKAGQSLRPCLDKVLKYIPPKKQRKAHISLAATAGMRLLEIQNQSQSRMILDEVRNTICSYPFQFHEARIISGADEGVYGWITVNYLLQCFLKYSWEGTWLHPESAQIQGAMDLGGSSTQLTFIPTGSINHMEGKMDLKLYGYNYTIYTHSYLCYGQQQSIRKYIATLLKGKDFKARIENPCYLKGYETKVILSTIYDSPCTIAQRPPSYDRMQSVTMFGSGKPDECYQGITTIFNFTACRGNNNCSFDGVYQPAVNGPFYAISAFFYVFHFLNLTSGNPSLGTAKRTIEGFCSRNWAEVNAAYPNEKQDRLRDYCTSANYIYILLVDGYKFNSSTWENIAFKQKNQGYHVVHMYSLDPI